MQILDIPALDLRLGDDLGEGMFVWVMSKPKESSDDDMVTVWWSSRPGVCMIDATSTELTKQLITYYSKDCVRVIRR